MIIINKNRDNIINMDNVTNIFLKNDRRGIQVSFTNGQGCLIGQYENEEKAMAAMALLRFRLDHHSVVELPTDEEARAQILASGMDKSGVHHYHDGSKTKGHGGS